MLSNWATSAASTAAPASGVGIGSQADVTAALDGLAKIASDGWLTSGEKPQAIKDWNDLNGSQADLVSKAAAAGVSSSAFTTAMTALSTYLTSLTPAWNDTTTDTAITAATWNTDWANAYNERLKLMNAITAAAQATGTGAQTGVNQINSVDYLTNQDKIQLLKDWNAELQIQTNLDAQAGTLGVTHSAYDTAVSNLSTNLIAAGAPSNWATTWPDGTTLASTSIVTNLRTWWTSIAMNRAALQKAIADKVQANAAYADALARSPNNLIKNGNSEDPNPTGPEALLVVAGIPFDGSKCRGVVGTDYVKYEITAKIPCAPGDQFHAECMARTSGASSGSVRIGWLFYDASGTFVNEAYNQIPNTNTYTKINADCTIPNGAVSCTVYLMGLMGAGDWSYWDSLYACRMINTGMLQADAIQTANYAEDGGGNPTAGARMSVAGTALKTAPGNLQVGSYLFTDYFFRILQALDGSSSAGRTIYRGNVDVSTRSGAPNIGRLTVTRRAWNATYNLARLEFKLQPSTTSDNLDSMRYIKTVLYRQSALGTTATLSGGNTRYLPISDRLYNNFTTDSATANATFTTLDVVDSAAASGAPAVLATLYNAYGPSDTNCFYSGSTGADGVDLVNNGTTWPAGITGGTGGSIGGGGGGGGGGCPAPWVKIQLASGLLVDAADLYDGAPVVGVNDITMEPAVGIVREPRLRWEDRVAVILEDGRAPEFSLKHRVAVADRGWVEVRDLKPGDAIVAQTPAIVRSLGRPIKAQVVSFTVEGCATYFSDGLLSHNLKILS